MKSWKAVVVVGLVWSATLASGCSSGSAGTGATEPGTSTAGEATGKADNGADAAVPPSEDATTLPPDAAGTGADAAAPVQDTSVAPGCTADSDCDQTPETPLCEPVSGACVALPRGHAVGWRDGSPGTVDLVPIYAAPKSFGMPQLPEAPDLEFDPMDPGTLWVVLREREAAAGCPEAAPTQLGCGAMEGKVLIIKNAGRAAQSAQIKVDPNAWHFMRYPPAIAFGAGRTFATCGEARTGNFTDDPADFIGPTLWSSDPKIFAIQPPGGNGSHLDMLHASPNCVGIAWERDNVYWCFNGKQGSLDRYDFHQDHGPGASDHSDGEIWRYAQGALSRVPRVPGHLAYHADSGRVYVADTGNGRIAALDTTSGTTGGALFPIYEVAATYQISGATLFDIVPPGTLQRPSGLEIHEDLLYVTDTATSTFHVFELDGTPIRSQQVDLPPGSLAGLAFSPEGEIYFTDLPTGRVLRLSPR